MRHVYKFRGSRLGVLHKKYLLWKFWKVFMKTPVVGCSIFLFFQLWLLSGVYHHWNILYYLTAFTLFYMQTWNSRLIMQTWYNIDWYYFLLTAWLLTHRLVELQLATRKLPESSLVTWRLLGSHFADTQLDDCILESLIIKIANCFGVTLTNINR